MAEPGARTLRNLGMETDLSLASFRKRRVALDERYLREQHQPSLRDEHQSQSANPRRKALGYYHMALRAAAS